ncbi:unnamed protein product [Oppiella nova]|uniref:Nuclear receptor domain-containing protein n=1 Tax=Oppiella nova TaxID=334625 RepID=A0A7R9QH90_9ACAR|nr:unnamed protein product [Oppiella nova]CAG2165906.1 unnamed protein product [Oppiella nova]
MSTRKVFSRGNEKGQELIRDVKENEMRRQLIKENKLRQQNCVHYSNTSIYNKFIYLLINSKTNSLSLVPISRPLTDYQNQFNELEGNRLQEVLFAMNSIREPINTTIRGEITDIKECEIMINKLYAKEIQNFVKMSSSLSDFKSLCGSDQIALIKYGSIEIQNVRSGSFYDLQTESWTINLDENDALILSLSLLEPHMITTYNAYKSFFPKIVPVLDNDSLTAILLFNPNRPYLIHRDTIRLHQKSYIHLLHRYFQLKYRSEYEAKARLMSLMDVMPDIRVLGDTLWRNGKESSPQNFNFGAITCGSCKAFFRRNAHKSDVTICHFGGNCDITVKTRRMCQCCRLKKCLAIGMTTDSFLSEDKKLQIKMKIREKRLKLIGKDGRDRSIGTNTNTSNDSFTTTSDNDMAAIQDNSSDQASTVECLSVVPISKPLTDYRNNLTELESNRLTEVLFAANLIREPKTTITATIKDMDECKQVLVYKFTKEVQNLFKMTNNLRAFKSLCTDDQVALMKYGGSDILNMRAVTIFDVNTQCWTLNLNDKCSVLLPLDVIKKSKTNNDSVIVDLLTAILLFNPNRPHLTHTDTVLLHQKSYIHLLYRYFQLKYRSESEARRRFLWLMKLMPDINQLGHTVWNNGAGLEPNSLGPLLREL